LKQQLKGKANYYKAMSGGTKMVELLIKLRDFPQKKGLYRDG